MSNVIESIERRQMRPNIPPFKAGDTVRVHFQVIEGQRRRTQVFEGIVIKRQGSGVHETFTVRKQSFGVGVERTFPLHSPKIERIEVAAIGVVRRAKLYYLRDKVGKRARVRTKAGAVLPQTPVAEPVEPRRSRRSRTPSRTSSRPRTPRLRMRRPRRRLPPATSPFPRPSPSSANNPRAGSQGLGVSASLRCRRRSGSRVGRGSGFLPNVPTQGGEERPPAARGERIGRTLHQTVARRNRFPHGAKSSRSRQ